MPVRDAREGYRPLLVLAEGGMGTVSVAIKRKDAFTRLYAIKRLRDAVRQEPGFRSMFMDEARLAGLIQHPHVVSVLDFGEDADGPFLVMDYIAGVSVAHVLADGVGRPSPIPLQICVRLIMEAAEGLHAAHELRDPSGRPLGLVHRDVSPQNLLVGTDGACRVVDFGIAKAWGRATRTDTGLLKGKVGYMSPEQLQFREPDRRSDLFSLGVVLFELCAGQRLYSHQGLDGARRVLDEPPPDLGEHRDDVPPALVELLFDLLAKDPSLRPPDAKTVARKLEAILADEVARDGRVEPAEFVRARFTKMLKRRSGEIASAVERGPDAPQAAAELAHPTVLERAVHAPERAAIRRPRNWGLVAAACVFAAGLVLAFGASQEPTSVAESATEPEPTAAEAASDRDPIEPPSEDVVPEPPTPEPEAAPVPHEETRPETAPPARRTRPVQAPARPAAPPSPEPTHAAEGLSLWEWQPQ